MVLQLIEKLPNLRGVVDARSISCSWKKSCASGSKITPGISVARRRGFFSVHPARSAVAGCSPRCRASRRSSRAKYFDLSRQEKYLEAREPQEQIAELHHLIKNAGESGLKDGLAGIKTAMAAMGRACGNPRPPVRALGEIERGKISEALAGMAFFKDEPRGW